MVKVKRRGKWVTVKPGESVGGVSVPGGGGSSDSGGKTVPHDFVGPLQPGTTRKPAPATYSGPVPLGADVETFRKTGRSISSYQGPVQQGVDVETFRKTGRSISPEGQILTATTDGGIKPTREAGIMTMSQEEYDKFGSPSQPFYAVDKDMSPSEAVGFGSFMSGVDLPKKLPGRVQTESSQRQAQQSINVAAEVYGQQQSIASKLTADPYSFVGQTGVTTKETPEGTSVSLSPEFMESKLDIGDIEKKAKIKTEQQLWDRPTGDIIGSRALEVGVGGAQALIGLGEFPLKLATKFGVQEVGKTPKDFEFGGILGDIRDQPTGFGTFLGKSLVIIPLIGAGVQGMAGGFVASRLAGATKWGATGTVFMGTLASTSPLKIQSGIIGTAYSTGIPKQVGTAKTDFLQLGKVNGKQMFTARGKATYTTPAEFTYGSIKYGWSGITPKITTLTATNIQSVGFGSNIFESTPTSQYGSKVYGRGTREILNIQKLPIQTSRYTFDLNTQTSVSTQAFKGWGTGVTTPKGFSVGEGTFYFTPKTTDVFTAGYGGAKPTYTSITDAPGLTKGEGISLGKVGKPYQIGEFSVTPGKVSSFLKGEDVGIYTRTDTRMFVKGAGISDKDSFGIGSDTSYTGKGGGQITIQKTTPKISGFSDMSSKIITSPTTIQAPYVSVSTSQLSGVGLTSGLISGSTTKTIQGLKSSLSQKPSISSALALSSIQESIITPSTKTILKSATTTKTGLITSTITTPIVSPVIAPMVNGLGWAGGLAPIVPIIGFPPFLPKPSLALGKKGPTRKFKGMGEQFIGSSYAAKVFDIRSGKEIKGSFGGMFTGLEIKPLTLGGEARVRRKGSKPINNGKAKKKTKKKTKR